MKIKKNLIAVAILGGMLVTACTPETIDTDDEQHTARVEKAKIKNSDARH